MVEVRKADVGGEDLPMQPLQGRTWIGAQLVRQVKTDLLVVVQRLGLSSTAIQREHQLGGHPLVQWMGGGEGGQVA